MDDVVGAVDRGIRRAACRVQRRGPEVHSPARSRALPGGHDPCARSASSRASSRPASGASSRPCRPPLSEVYAAASTQVARAAARLKHEQGLLVVGLDLAGQEHGYPAEDHRRGYQVAHEAFLGKDRPRGRGLRAGVDLPGHQETCTPTASATGPGCSTTRRSATRASWTARRTSSAWPEFIADKRITIEVCLTSNQQTVPELAGDLKLHPYGEMRKRRLSTTFCTDNRLVSNTDVSNEITRAVAAFGLTRARGARQPDLRLQAQLLPGTYLEKRTYVRQVIDYADRVLSAPLPRPPDAR